MKPLEQLAVILALLAFAACSSAPDRYAVESPGNPTAPPHDAPAEAIASPGVRRAPQVAPLPPPEGLPTMPPPDKKPEIQPRALDDGSDLGPVEVVARSASRRE
jgi:hypothetical protein